VFIDNTTVPPMELVATDYFFLVVAAALTILTYASILFVLNTKFARKRSRAANAFGIALTVFLFLVALVILPTLPVLYNSLLIVAFGAILYGYLLVFREGKNLLKLFWLFVILVFFAIVQTATSAFSLVFFGTVYTGTLSLPAQTLISLFTAVMMFITCFILVRKRRRATEMPPLVTFVLVLVPALSCIVLLFWADSIFIAPDADHAFAMFQFLGALALALINYAVFILYEYMTDESEKSLEQQARIQRAELSAVHYGELQALYHETREWRHDYLNHLTVIEGLLGIENYARLDEYLQELKGAAKKMSFRVSSGNEAIDAIINTKISRAEAEGIEFESVVTLDLSSLQMTSVELASLFGNLIDNAIEACQRVEDVDAQRKIVFKITKVNNQVCIYVMNSTPPLKLLPGEKLKSSKKRGDHGIGLSRIDSIVESYGGMVQRKIDGNSFETFVLLPLNE
jgi:two-component system sensor histidine kinase AgrC